VDERMTMKSKMFKDEKKWGNHKKQFALLLEVVCIFKVLEFIAI